MILQALNSYYERLEADPQADVAPFGMSRQKISFCVTLNEDGTLHELTDLRVESGKRLVPQSLVVLGNAKPSGSGINPGFLWDNSAYLLGFKPDDPKPKRTHQSCEAFRQRHLDVESAIDDPEFSAVCRFLENWKPEAAQGQPLLVELATGFGVFRLRGQPHYVHERDAVRQWWLSQLDSDDDEKTTPGQCLVTGETAPIARLHEPKIKGVWGAQSAGAAIVSFNDKAYESYGKSQSANAPVSERAAFQYCTALNRLLASDSRQRIQIGDATTVFWTAQPTPAESLLPWVFEPSRDAEDETEKLRVQTALKQIAAGKYPGEFGDPETPFYVLGLSPNAARISVRFWWVSTLGDLVAKLHRHYLDMEILERGMEFRLPSISQILDETVPAKKGKPDREKVSPTLAGAVARSVLTATPYPSALLQQVLKRVATEGFVIPDKRQHWHAARRRRASILKGCINRHLMSLPPNHRENSVDPYLNKIHPHAGYQSGRLMAVLVFTQERALKNVNSGLARRYLSAASSTPGLHLGRLQALAEIAHLPKLPKRLGRYLRDEMMAINSQIQDEVPRRLDHIGQSLFMLGYYQELVHLEYQGTSIRRAFRTTHGEWVYSRGEKAVADSLAKLNIPYCYEPKVTLDTGPDRIPDFLIPRGNPLHDCYIEYLGVPTEDYENRWQAKLAGYSEIGITLTGGARGKLYVIDARSEDWDEARIFSQLQSWFPPATH